MNKSKCLLIAVLFSCYTQAQDIIVTESVPESSDVSAEIIATEVLVNSSPIAKDNTEQSIIALAPYTAVAPGVCLVIGNMLSAFCDSNPQDTSCQFQ